MEDTMNAQCCNHVEVADMISAGAYKVILVVEAGINRIAKLIQR